MPVNGKKVQFHKDIKRRRIRKSLSQRIKRLNCKENHYRTCDDEHVASPLVEGELVKVEPRTKVVLKKSIFNFVQSVNRQVRNKIDFLFFGMMYIDEEALKSQAKDRSLLRSLFNFYSINYVRISSDYLLIKIQKNYENSFPIEYIIDRFKSQGDRKFYEMAEMVEKINQRMGNYQGAKAPSLYDHQVQKCLEKLKGKLCITLISPNVIAFSRELLEMSGYSVQTIASSCLANRSFLFDIFLSDNYMEEYKDHLSKFGLSRRLRSGEISAQEYTRQSCISSFSSIIDKNNNRIQFKSKRYNLDPGVLCWEIQKIVGREKLLSYQKLGEEKMLGDYNAKRMERDLREVEGLTISADLGKEEKIKVACGYRQSGSSVKQEDD